MTTIYVQIEKINKRFDELEQLLADPVVVADYSRMNELAQERSEIEELVVTYRRYRIVEKQLAENRQLLNESDPDMQELAALEIEQLEAEQPTLEQKMKQTSNKGVKTRYQNQINKLAPKIGEVMAKFEATVNDLEKSGKLTRRCP